MPQEAQKIEARFSDLLQLLSLLSEATSGPVLVSQPNWSEHLATIGAGAGRERERQKTNGRGFRSGFDRVPQGLEKYESLQETEASAL